MHILITKPEPSNKQGGMTIALNQVVEYLRRNDNYQISCLEHADSGQFIIHTLNSTSVVTTFSNIQDAINFSNPALFIGVGWHTWSEKAIRIAKRNRCKTIFWSHGVGASTWYSSKPLLSVARILLRAHQLIDLFKTLLQTDQLVIAYKRQRWQDTRSIDEVIARCLNVGSTVIPNAIDSSLWTPLSKPSKPRPWVLSTGRMEWQKGMKKAFEIVQITKHYSSENCELQWLVMHPGGTKINNETKAIRSLSAKHNSESQIIERTGLKNNERRDVLRQALCLLCWSDTEYQSLSILEALSCGCPVISRPVGWLRHQSVPGVMLAKSQAKAAACVMRLASDQTLRNQLAAAARQGIVPKHRIETVATQWEAVIEKIADE